MKSSIIRTKQEKNLGSKKIRSVYRWPFIFHIIIVILQYQIIWMGVTKTHIFSVKHNELAKIAKVMAHPARIAILEYISRQENCICTDLVEEIGLAQPTVSQHLNEIKKVGLLLGTFEGKNLCYCINRERWIEVQQLLSGFFLNINQNCC